MQHTPIAHLRRPSGPWWCTCPSEAGTRHNAAGERCIMSEGSFTVKIACTRRQTPVSHAMPRAATATPTSAAPVARARQRPHGPKTWFATPPARAPGGSGRPTLAAGWTLPFHAAIGTPCGPTGTLGQGAGQGRMIRGSAAVASVGQPRQQSNKQHANTLWRTAHSPRCSILGMRCLPASPAPDAGQQ